MLKIFSMGTPSRKNEIGDLDVSTIPCKSGNHPYHLQDIYFSWRQHVVVVLVVVDAVVYFATSMSIVRNNNHGATVVFHHAPQDHAI